ncbi:hypothetical protein TPA0909_68890 [Streptomyces albus]|nr:hypothetical protein TPA0909_68890 [Streptomyces albus]
MIGEQLPVGLRPVEKVDDVEYVLEHRGLLVAGGTGGTGCAHEAGHRCRRGRTAEVRAPARLVRTGAHAGRPGTLPARREEAPGPGVARTFRVRHERPGDG